MDARAFQCNGSSFGPSALPTSHLQGIVTLALLPSSLIRLEAPGNLQISAKTPDEVGEIPALYCFLILPEGARGAVKPCWNLARE